MNKPGKYVAFEDLGGFENLIQTILFTSIRPLQLIDPVIKRFKLLKDLCLRFQYFRQNIK